MDGSSHSWKPVCVKALAKGTGRAVFVITAGESVAWKFTSTAEPSPWLRMKVEDMGPDGAGKAQVSDKDIVLYFDSGETHYNALPSPRFFSNE